MDLNRFKLCYYAKHANTVNKIRVLMSPLDLEMLETHPPELLESIRGIKSVFAS